MEYVVENRKYQLNYSELREDFSRFHAMTDDEFLHNLVPALHFVNVVSYLKETPGYILTSDEGLIHQLVHLLDEGTREMTLPRLREIREQFAIWCRLA